MLFSLRSSLFNVYIQLYHISNFSIQCYLSLIFKCNIPTEKQQGMLRLLSHSCTISKFAQNWQCCQFCVQYKYFSIQ